MYSRRWLCNSQNIRLFHTSRGLFRSPLKQYEHLVEIGEIHNDEFQRAMLESMNHLYSDLENYVPPKINLEDIAQQKPKRGFFSSFFGSGSGSRTTGAHSNHPKGIYLYGDVGCGKTMLMDMFYTTVPSHLTKKRIHFHSFMQSVHKRAHQLKMKHGGNFDATPSIAAEIASESNVLCFDEFQVTDVADAMILRRLIDILYSPNHGVVTFMTSNRAPDDLYQNGVQRETFIPCIETLKRMNYVEYLYSPTDYRKIPRPSSGAYFFPPAVGKSLKDPDVAESASWHAESWFDYFCQGGPTEENTHLTIWGRPILVPKSCPGRVAQFSFNELCGKPLGAADYLELTKNFPSFVVTDIPLLNVHKADLTRRFITFLDAAYESHTRLAVTAERPFEHLFTEEGEFDPTKVKHDKESSTTGESTVATTTTTIPNEDTPTNDADDFISSTHFSGAEEKFAFQRALSRLKQMSTKQWLDQALI